MKTKEEFVREADALLKERMSLKTQISEAKRKHAAGGPRSSWQWITNTEDKMRRLHAQEMELRNQGKLAPAVWQIKEETRDISMGRKYRSLCSVIKKEFGEDTLASLVRDAEELVRAEIDAGIIEEIPQ